MHSKVSSDWLPSYIKATRQVLEILKMVGYFPYSPRTYYHRIYMKGLTEVSTLVRLLGTAVLRLHLIWYGSDNLIIRDDVNVL